MQANQNNFQSLTVNVRIKLSALWTSLMFCYIYGDYFELYVPKKVEGLLSGHNLLNTPMKLFAAACMLAIPALMIPFSLIINSKICRILNIVLGIFFTLLMVTIGAFSIAQWLTFYVFLAFIERVLSILIIRNAMAWPKV